MEKIRDLAERIDTFAFAVDPYEYRDVYDEGSDGVQETVDAILAGGQILAGLVEWLTWYLDDEDIRTSLQIFVGDGIGASILQNGSYWGATTPSSCQLGHIVVRHSARAAR